MVSVPKRKFLIHQLKKARRFIEEHFSESIDLNQIAKSAHLSTFHFHRLFKTNFGMSPGEYVTLVRLNKSIELLFYTKKSISEISFEIGYPNTETYIRNFKKRFQTTPNHYRKSILKKPDFNLKTNELDSNQKIRNPFKGIKEIDEFYLCILRFEGKTKQKIKTLYQLLDKTIPLGLYNEGFRFYGRSFDPPSIMDKNDQRWEIGVKISKSIIKNIHPPLEIVKWKKGKYLQIIHEGPAIELEKTYEKAYEYIIHSSQIQIANDPIWEVYRKIPPFHQKTEIEILIRLKE